MDFLNPFQATLFVHRYLKIVKRTSADIDSWLAASSQLSELRLSEKHKGWWISGGIESHEDEDLEDESTEDTSQDEDDLPEQASIFFIWYSRSVNLPL